MAIKVTLKNSVVQDSVPTTSHLAAVGELALNANINSLGIYMRASDNSIVKMAGPGSVTTPAASTTVAGIAELATSAETTTGTDTARVTTPAGVKAVTDAERTTSNNTYLALAGGTLTGVLAATAGSNSAASIHFGDTDSGIFGGTNTVSLTAGGTTRLTADTGVSVAGALAVTGTITSTDDLTIPDKIIHSGDTDTAIRFPAANTVSVETGGSEALRVDSSRRVLVGTSSNTSPIGWNNNLQVAGTSAVAGISIRRDEASTGGALLIFGKSRGSLNGSTTVIAGDQIGGMYFAGADGTDVNSIAAQISAEVEGTIAGNRMPGRLLFKTTADSAGSVSPTTRLKITSAGLVNVPDNGKFTAGASDDLSIYHDSSNSFITNSTGIFLQRADDIRLQNAGGSEVMLDAAANGAVQLYYDNVKKLETFANGIDVSGQVRVAASSSGYGSNFYDSIKSAWGDSQDLQIWHTGSFSKIVNLTGDLNLYADTNVGIYNAAGSDLKALFVTDGAVELYYDNSKKLHTFTGGVKFFGTLEADDSDKIKLGDNADLELYHDGSNSYIKDTGTGNLYIFSENLRIENADGSESYIEANVNGGVELYYDGVKKLETTSYGFTSSGYSSIGDGTWAYLTGDSNKSAWGNNQDLQIWHNATDSLIVNSTGNLYQRTTGNLYIQVNGGSNENAIVAKTNGAIELYHDNEKKVVTSSSGLEIYGTDGGAATLDLRSDEGTHGADMFRFHVDDGGPLYIKNYTDGAWENSLMCVGASYTALYHDNSLKLETTSGGAKVTGFLNLTAGLHVPDGSSSGDSSIVIGTHNDLRLFHSSANSHIYHNGTGNLFVEAIDSNITLRAGNNAGGTHDSLVCTNNEGVKLYYDTGKKFETTSGGVTVTGDLTVVNNLVMEDSDKIKLGGSADLEIFFDGTNGYIYAGNDGRQGYVTKIENQGNHNNRYGIRIQCGIDDSSGTNYAIGFGDGNNTDQGYITFSGGTVTYGTFTAYHPCIVPDSENPSDSSNAYPYGTLLETISIEYTQNNGADTERGIRYKVQKTQSANSRKVLGAYGSSMNGGPSDQTNEHQALVLGDGHILVNNAGGNIEVGDGICSSATAGIGQKATANPSMIIGIAQEAVTFTGSENKLVAVQYGLQQFIPWT